MPIGSEVVILRHDTTMVRDCWFEESNNPKDPGQILVLRSIKFSDPGTNAVEPVIKIMRFTEQECAMIERLIRERTGCAVGCVTSDTKILRG
jgi:hypothetical protein